MFTIPAENRETQILMHALSASIAMAAEGGAVYLDLSEINEERPAARKVLVEEHLAAVLGELEAVIRAKKGELEPSPAVLGSRLIANSETYNPGNRTYTPGPGFETLIKAIAADADATYEEAATGGSTR
jgi:hypothetical protein